MTPHHLKPLIGLLDRAIKIEHEENRQLRSGCPEDCREYGWTPLEATPESVIHTSPGVIFTPCTARYIVRPRHGGAVPCFGHDTTVCRVWNNFVPGVMINDNRHLS